MVRERAGGEEVVHDILRAGGMTQQYYFRAGSQLLEVFHTCCDLFDVFVQTTSAPSCARGGEERGDESPEGGKRVVEMGGVGDG